MSYIQAIATALPEHKVSKSGVLAIGEEWLGTANPARELFDRFVSSSKVANRNFSVSLKDILAMPGQEARSALFHEVGTRLGSESLRGALDAAQISSSDLEGLVFTSCSVPVIPSIDARIAAAAGCPSTMVRVPIFQYGCAGGSAGLALANRLVSSVGTTAILSVELCSLVHHRSDHSGASLLGSALFGDGSACAVLSSDPGPLEIVDSRSFLIPESTHLMGYTQQDDGPHLKLDKELPKALAVTAPRVIHDFLAAHELHSSNINYWLFHPGGAKILAAFEEHFSIPRSASRWAWEVLEEFGNMSSATVLFVMKKFLEERPFVPGERALLVGIGPGLTIELSLISCH